METLDLTGGAETVVEDAAREPSEATARFDAWFRRDYPRMVGLARRVLDRESSSSSSLGAAEEVVTDVFVHQRHRRVSGDESDTTRLIPPVLDRCLVRMVGHPGEVRLHYEVLGPDVEFSGFLPLAELHEALTGLRRWDRRTGLLALAGGFSPAEVSTILARPLDDVLERLGRVATRLADGRRVGGSEAYVDTSDTPASGVGP